MPPTRDILLEADGLTRLRAPARRGAEPVYAVRDVSFTLARGEVLGLLGLNGAGKSTTLNMLAGTLVPDAGSVTIAGRSMSAEPLEARARLGYLPDRPPVIDEMRVEGYLKLAARLRRLPKADVAAAVAAAIDDCGLGEVERRRIAGLSKGYRQRVGIAQAIVHRPDVVLLDEPGSGLDPRQSEELRALVRKLGERSAVVFSTHLLSEVRSTCDRIGVVHGGVLVADVSVDDEDVEALFARLVGSPAPAPTAHARSVA